MEKIAVLALFVISLTNFAIYTEGLRCYNCAHIESGEIDGYEVDDSCKWASKPDDKFLKDCLADGEDNDQGNKFEFVCTETRVDGFFKSGAKPAFRGTLRHCGARLVGTSEKTSNSTVQNIKECKQGRLSKVVKDFKNPTGQEYIAHAAELFDDESLTTNVKYCVCDSDGCWEQREEIPDDDEEGPGTGSATVNYSTLSLVISSLLVFWRSSS